MKSSNKYTLFQEHNYGITKCQFCGRRLTPTPLQSCNCSKIKEINIMEQWKTARECKNREHLLYSVAHGENDPYCSHKFVCSEECANMFILSEI